MEPGWSDFLVAEAWEAELARPQKEKAGEKTVTEMMMLSELMQSTQDLKTTYLQCRGVLPSKLIYVNAQNNGYAVWYTPPQEVDLFFNDSLGIASGKTKIPAMLWKATKERLQVFALKGKAKPNDYTKMSGF